MLQSIQKGLKSIEHSNVGKQTGKAAKGVGKFAKHQYDVAAKLEDALADSLETPYLLIFLGVAGLFLVVLILRS